MTDNSAYQDLERRMRILRLFGELEWLAKSQHYPPPGYCPACGAELGTNRSVCDTCDEFAGDDDDA